MFYPYRLCVTIVIIMYIAIIIITVIAKVVSCIHILCALFYRYFICGGDVTLEGQRGRDEGAQQQQQTAQKNSG